MKLAPLDVLFSEFIRRRAIARAGGCERCLSQKIDTVKDNGEIFPAWKYLDCAHYHPRTQRSTRWDTDNACGLCSGCHRYIDNDADAKVEFFLGILGQDDKDMLASRNRQTHPKPDKEAIKLYLQEKLKEIG